MAQTIKTFFDLGGAKRIADPRVEEQQRQEQLAIEEQRRQDALRAALAGEGLQRDQLAASQQRTMAQFGMDQQRLGLDQQRLGLDRDKFSFGKQEAGAGREHDMLLEQLRQGGLDTRQQAGFDHASGMAEDQRGFLQGESELERALRLQLDDRAGDRFTTRETNETNRNLDRLNTQRDLAESREKGEDRRLGVRESGANTRAESAREAADKRAKEQNELRAWEALLAKERSDRTNELQEKRFGLDQDRLGLQKDELKSQADRAKEAQSQAARERLISVIGPESRMTDEEVLRQLKHLSETDPQIRSLLQGEFSDLLRARLKSDIREENSGIGGKLGGLLRTAGSMYTPIEDPYTRLKNKQDMLEQILRGPTPPPPPGLGFSGFR